MNYEIIKGEQKTDEWQKLREGLITGSVAKKVKGKGTEFLYETLAMMTTKREPKEAFGKHVDRGNELEPVARAEYEKHTGEKVETVAFIKNGRIGCSPDGLIFKKKAIKKVIEIKCPDTNNHIRYILENKVPAEHVDQIVHAYATVDDCDEIDFVSYDPKFLFKPLHIIKTTRMQFALQIQTAHVAYNRFIKMLDENYSRLIS